ncbi:MAG: TrbG/VirB9 family P-type conjugative transfer protein [Thermoanaerobaculia bacterium]|nr:TrbG/VirB9 family P-type conjugative transfer protein [Thermoanaerobaculia bacterium]
MRWNQFLVVVGICVAVAQSSWAQPMSELLQTMDEERRLLEEQLSALQNHAGGQAGVPALPTRPAPGGLQEPVIPVGPDPAVPSLHARLASSNTEEQPTVHASSTVQEIVYGQPLVVQCLVTRVCAVLLEPGENILHRMVGDTHRWIYEEGSIGPVGGEVPVIAVSPRTTDLVTNVLVLTDRRLYRIQLRSPKNLGRDDITFTEAIAVVHPAPPAPAPARSVPESETTTKAPPITVADLNFGYAVELPWRANRLGWEPETIYDDGTSTFIKVPESVLSRGDLPIPMALDGKERIAVPFTFKGDTFEIPHLIDIVDLVATGVGRKPRWVRILRQSDGGAQ